MVLRCLLDLLSDFFLFNDWWTFLVKLKIEEIRHFPISFQLNANPMYCNQKGYEIRGPFGPYAGKIRRILRKSLRRLFPAVTGDEISSYLQWLEATLGLCSSDLPAGALD